MNLSSAPVLEQIAQHGRSGSAAQRLEGLAARLLDDLQELEARLQGVFAGAPEIRSRAAARHLLDGRGKRVRPALCLLAARLRGGAPVSAAARDLALAAELAHAATLLHDDVIDDGEIRRGRPTSRVLHGNTASVLGGDLLLIEALAAVERAGVPELMAAMLATLRRMVEAETLQLELRGCASIGVDDYFEICRGKTAALFEWLLEAGARVAGAGGAVIDSLRAYGRDLGLAFQLVDDLLDLERDPVAIGKSVLQDIGHGTITFPAIAALEAEPALAARVRAAAAGESDDGLGVDLVRAVRAHGGLEHARREIAARTTQARASLAPLARTAAVEALDGFAVELAERSR